MMPATESTTGQEVVSGAGPMSNADLEHFLRKGYLIVPSGVKPEVHESIKRSAVEIVNRGPHAAAHLGDDVYPAIPELGEVLYADKVQEALKSVLGEGVMLHEHRHLHLSTGWEQMWHKDSYWGFRKLRHHRPRWCMMLYYPQDTTIDMGPTHILSGSQYWTIDTESREQGEDILSPESGRISMFVEGSSAEKAQQLFQAQDQLVTAQHRNLVEHIALTVPAGSCVLMHYDLYHRAGFKSHEDAPLRAMFKFQFIRTTEPTVAAPPLPALTKPIVTALKPTIITPEHEEVVDVSMVPSKSASSSANAAAASAAPEVEPILEDIRSWFRGGWASANVVPAASSRSPPAPEGGAVDTSKLCEVDCVAHAYRLGLGGVASIPELVRMLTVGSEAEARAATYGLMAVGPAATASLLPLLTDISPRVRAWSSFALGECSRPSTDLLDHFERALHAEQLPAVEAAYLQALGCVASRSRALQEEALCHRCTELAMPYLLPIKCFCSLRGENACLVALMAGGLTGDVSQETLNALMDIANYCDDRYMVAFALEVLNRRTKHYYEENQQSNVVQCSEEMTTSTIDSISGVRHKAGAELVPMSG